MERKGLIASEKTADATLLVGEGAKREWREAEEERKGATTDGKHTMRIQEPNVGSWPAKYLQSWRQMAT